MGDPFSHDGRSGQGRSRHRPPLCGGLSRRRRGALRHRNLHYRFLPDHTRNPQDEFEPARRGIDRHRRGRSSARTAGLAGKDILVSSDFPRSNKKSVCIDTAPSLPFFGYLIRTPIVWARLARAVDSTQCGPELVAIVPGFTNSIGSKADISPPPAFKYEIFHIWPKPFLAVALAWAVCQKEVRSDVSTDRKSTRLNSS